jgi:hypothetical protein
MIIAKHIEDISKHATAKYSSNISTGHSKPMAHNVSVDVASSKDRGSESKSTGGTTISNDKGSCD